MPQGNAWLWLSLIIWRLKILDFLYFAVSVPCFNRLRLWWNCASWIDDYMHWALIDVLLWYSFCRHDYSFFCGCFLAACYYCFQSYMQFCASRKRLALTESLFFGDLKTWIFFTLLSLFRLLFNCDYDETVLLELMITCTGLWLTCFVILFLYTRLLSFPRLLSTGLLLLLSKIYMQFCVSRKRLALIESDFLETKKFRFSLLCCLCSVFYSIAIVMKLCFLNWW